MSLKEMFGISKIKKLLWSRPVLKTLSALLVPFRILYRSHVYYLIYVLSFSYLVYIIATSLLKSYNQWLTNFMEEHSVSLIIGDTMGNLGVVLVSLLLCPLLLSLLASPARHIFLYNRILPGTMTNELPLGIKNTFQTGIVAAVKLVFSLLPVFVLVMVYSLWAAKQSDKSVQQAYILVASITCLTIIYHQIPVLFAPILSAVTGYDGHSTVRLAPSILERGRLRLTLLVGLCVACISVSYVYSAPYVHHSKHQLLAISIIAFWGWYFLNHIFFILLKKVVAFEQRHTEVPAQPPQAYPANIENLVVS